MQFHVLKKASPHYFQFSFRLTLMPTWQSGAPAACGVARGPTVLPGSACPCYGVWSASLDPRESDTTPSPARDSVLLNTYTHKIHTHIKRLHDLSSLFVDTQQSAYLRETRLSREILLNFGQF